MRTALLFITGLALSLAGCANPFALGPDELPFEPFPPCQEYAEPERIGTLRDQAITEASGLCTSRRHPDVLFLHNDSGDTPTIYAARPDGTELGHFTIDGGIHVDWEDIACAPCEIDSDDPCLYIGDVGDNRARRETVTVYVVPEPNDPHTDGTLPILRELTVTYEDGPRDVEAMLVHPDSLDIYFVSKNAPKGESGHPVLRVPGTADGDVVARTVASVTPAGSGKIHQFTGGDIHPLGFSLVLRTYGGVQEHRIDGGAPFDSIFETEGIELPRLTNVDAANQWEAVAYDHFWVGVITVPEGVGAPIYRWLCDRAGLKTRDPTRAPRIY